MSQILPPPPSPSITGESPLDRVHFRLWQIVMSAITLLTTVWFFTLNPIVGIAASFLAKHVLVAILAAGLNRNRLTRGDGSQAPLH